MSDQNFIHPDLEQAMHALETQQAVLALDMDCAIIAVNQRYLDMSGYRREDLIGRPFSVLLAPELTPPMAYEELTEMLTRGDSRRRGRDQRRTLEQRRADGKPFWANCSFCPAYDSDGNALMTVIFSVDVTAEYERLSRVEATQTALSRSQAVIEFSLSGEVLHANDNFLKAFGYTLTEVIGQHHSKFCDPEYVATPAYKKFWEDLGLGYFKSGEFHRFAKGDRDVWIVASYNPILDGSGQVTRIVKFATDITARKVLAQEKAAARQAAVSRLQAVIEFKTTGEIISANDNFLRTVGYTLPEIVGRHHRIFCDPAYSQTNEYRQFWQDLADGSYQTGEFMRICKNGQPIWLVASYNPVLDDDGNVVGVVKYATDVTAKKVAMSEIVEGLSELAKGNLTPRISDNVSGEFTQMRDGFNTTLESFARMVDEIRANFEEMNSEAGEIAQGAGDLARRGESQAASLEQTAAAVEQISGNIAMTSQSARDADNSARDAQQIVENGAQVVAQAIAAIERIDEHTKKMGEFTRVIEGFAFQTNLLSINAAVEAARAGEVGRGFAVVANEVRNLAQQSAKASQNIADLIGKSETEVKSGVRLVRDAGNSLDQIRKAVSGMVENIAGIAHATTEQSTGVREVSEALSQLDDVNQANLSMSEQYATAAASLLTQVEELNGLMERFDTGAAAGAALAHPPKKRVSDSYGQQRMMG